MRIPKIERDLPCNLYIRCISTALKEMVATISSCGLINCIEIAPEKAEPIKVKTTQSQLK